MPNEPFDTFAALLNEVATKRNPTLALTSTARAAFDRLAATPGVEENLEVRYLLGWGQWFRYLALPEDEDQEAWDYAVNLLTPCFVAEIGDLPEPLLPVLADNAVEEAEDLLTGARQTNDRAAITSAVSLWRRIVAATPPENPRLPGMLSNLAVALQTQYPWSAELDDLDAAIDALRRATRLRLRDPAHRTTILSNLAGALYARFEATGAMTDLDESIDVMRTVGDLVPVNDPARATYRANLGIVLIARYERSETLADLDEAISELMDACSAATEGDSAELPVLLSTLGVAVRLRFDRTADGAYLELATKVGRLAVDATPIDHPTRHRILANLAVSLNRRLERSGDPADLDAAVVTGREAVAFTPDTHHDLPAARANLSAVLRQRYELRGLLDDLNEAIDIAQDALTDASSDNPDTALLAINLAKALQARHRDSGARADYERARAALEWATRNTTAASFVRIRAAREAAVLIGESDPGTAKALLEIAVRLVPVVASRRLSRPDQEFVLRGVIGLARDATAMSLAANMSPDGSVPSCPDVLPLLELGQGVILSNVLNARGELAKLRARHPQMAQRISELHAELNLVEANELILSEATPDPA